MGMKNLLMMAILSAASGLAQTGTISGVVQNGAGEGVSGATVFLASGGQTTTTAGDGTFSLTNIVSVEERQNQAWIVAHAAKIHQGVLSFVLPERSKVSISRYSPKGEILFHTSRVMEKGAQTITLDHSGDGVFLYKIKTGKTSFFLKGYNLGRATAQSSPMAGALTKQSAARFEDVLAVTASGYLKFEMPITTHDTSGVIIQLEESDLSNFSFFVTSLRALQELSDSQHGFGGDLRFGETGPGAGIRGADKICATIADMSMPGASAKGWRAFLSVTDDGTGQQANAIDRVGDGPWYDRLGRLVASNVDGLLNDRPDGDPTIINDLPNENGIPNGDPDGTGRVDNHHMLTASDENGELYSPELGNTCNDWTSSEGETGQPHTGLAYPRGGGMGGRGNHWIDSWTAYGCAAGISLVQDGAGDSDILTVGEGGGYGGFYCFALSP